jgi:hypothetical protein
MSKEVSNVEIKVTGCKHCPFYQKRWAGHICEAPTKPIQRIGDGCYNLEVTPDFCPLRTQSINITLKDNNNGN